MDDAVVQQQIQARWLITALSEIRDELKAFHGEAVWAYVAASFFAGMTLGFCAAIALMVVLR